MAAPVVRRYPLNTILQSGFDVMKGIYLDPEAEVITEQFAVVKAGRRQRDRVPETVVEIVESLEAAQSKAMPDKQVFAAKVIGPSRSSEGLRLYYIVEWFK